MSNDEENIIEKVGSVKKVGSANKVAQPIAKPELVANKDHFDHLMSQANPANAAKDALSVQKTEQANSSTGKPSLMDEIRSVNQKVDYVSKANYTPKDLIAQSQEVIGQIDLIKEKLSTPNLELKGSVQTLLKNKLSHIDDNLRIALQKAGVDYVHPEKPVANAANPIDRFLGFLTDGQYQLESLAGEVQGMALRKGELSPAYMLALQIKVGYIQQELEFFTSLLNKALESTKTIMNVQV
jgi:hypothetical protein